MRKIQVTSWKAKDTDGTEKEENLIELLEGLISMIPVQSMPRGLDNFRTLSRIAKAFDKAKETKILSLEESDYSFLKKSMEAHIPATWGRLQDRKDAVEKFLEVKHEEKDKKSE